MNGFSHFLLSTSLTENEDSAVKVKLAELQY